MALSEGTPYFNAFQTGAINGLVPQWASKTALTLSTGTCRDSTDTCNIYLINSGQATIYGSQYVSTTLGATGTTLTILPATTGANGSETGTIAASTMCAVYVIANSLSNPSYPTAGFLSPNSPLNTSSTINAAPALPTGYDIYRQVGWWPMDGSGKLLQGYYVGTGNNREFWYDSMQAILTSGANTSYTGVTMTGLVPVVQFTPVTLYADFNPVTAGNLATFRPTLATATTAFDISGVVASKVQDEQFTMIARFNTTAASPIMSIDFKTSGTGDVLDVSLQAFKVFM